MNGTASPGLERRSGVRLGSARQGGSQHSWWLSFNETEVMVYHHLLLLLALLDGGRPAVHQERVDLIEHNTKYEESGKVAFEQIILWEWSEDYRRHHVVAWWIVDKPHEMPVESHRGYELTKQIEGREFLIFADCFRQTHTKNDPERDNKVLFPEKYRRGIGRKPLPLSTLDLDIAHP